MIDLTELVEDSTFKHVDHPDSLYQYLGKLKVRLDDGTWKEYVEYYDRYSSDKYARSVESFLERFVRVE